MVALGMAIQSNPESGRGQKCGEHKRRERQPEEQLGRQEEKQQRGGHGGHRRRWSTASNGVETPDTMRAAKRLLSLATGKRKLSQSRSGE